MTTSISQPPWPVVGECFSGSKPDHACPQCNGSHEHQWLAWHQAPETQPGSGSTVVDGHSGPGIPVRCKVCGARKCDWSNCMLRRHHRETEHEVY